MMSTPLLLQCFLFFFFSSRRRHTRFDCDWSSDVCSSDLSAEGLRQLLADRKSFQASVSHGDVSAVALDSGNRSEERRVGKECRSRWWGDECKKEVCKWICGGRDIGVVVRSRGCACGRSKV